MGLALARKLAGSSLYVLLNLYTTGGKIDFRAHFGGDASCNPRKGHFMEFTKNSM